MRAQRLCAQPLILRREPAHFERVLDLCEQAADALVRELQTALKAP